MSKTLQRKKQLRNSLRRSGAFSNTVNKVVEETKKVVKHAEKAASDAGKVVSKKVEKTVEATKEQAQKVATSMEDFAANLGGLSVDRAKTFYDEGIKSAADFKNWTEKELLALKGIGRRHFGRFAQGDKCVGKRGSFVGSQAELFRRIAHERSRRRAPPRPLHQLRRPLRPRRLRQEH